MARQFIYEQISNQLIDLIEQGVLKPGDKLDSIRTLCKQKNISHSTAFKAYEELVIKNFVEARVKSGYYVKSRHQLMKEVSSPVEIKSSVKPVNSEEIIAYAFQEFSRSDLVKLSVTTPDISLLPVAKLNKSMNEALRMSDNGCLEYENVEGNIELRRQISRHTFDWNEKNYAQDIVITQGCIESILLSLMTVTKPGDTVIIQKPTYFSIYSIIKNLGLKVIEIDVHPTSGMDFNYFEQGIKKVKVSACIFITNFNNPTGYSLTDEEKYNLVHVLAKAEIPLIEDNIYGEIYFGSSRPITCKSFDEKGLVMLCSSMSKTLAPGYRIGWCAPGKFKERFMQIKIMHTVSAASPTQAAIAQFFNSGRYDLHIKKLRKTLQIESMKYLDAISTYFPKGTKVTSPKGGFVLWVELDKHVNATELFYEAIHEGISIWPGPIFSATKGFENYVRISYGTPYTESVENGLRQLGILSQKFL